MKLFPTLLLATVLPVTLASAQQFLIHNYQNNLPSLDVMGVSQDDNGMMWFATRGGMIRFDGIHWEIAGPATLKIPQSYRHVIRDNTGRIWVLAVNVPFLINSFDGLQWEPHTVPDAKDWGWDVIDFAVSAQPGGTIFMAIASEKILSFWDGKKWHQFGYEKEFAKIRALTFLGEKLYLATADGLMKLDLGQMAVLPVHPEGMTPGPIQALALDNSEDPALWLVGADWVGQLKDGIFYQKGTNLPLGFSKLESGTRALAGPSGGLFFGGVEGLFHFHPQRGLIELSQANGFISGGINDIFLDREENIWFVGTRGISKLVSMRLETFDSRSGLAFDEVSAIVQRADGSMVLGHEGGLTFLDPDPVVFPITSSMPGTGRVMDLAIDPEGQLWIAFDQWGLALLNEDRSLQWFGPDDGLPEYIFALHFDQNGEMWVGGSLGLYRKVGDHFEMVSLNSPDLNTKPFVRRIDEGSDGSLLVSTGMLGIFEIREGSVEYWVGSSDGYRRSCYQVFESGRGYYWVATSAGLCRVLNGELQLTTFPDPEIRQPIYCIIEDDLGHFWFGTDNGAIRWDGRKLTTIDNRDGLLGREFNRDALMQARDGRIWMGTDRGLSIYDGRFDQPRKSKPLVEIQSSLVDGLAVELADDGELDSSLYELVFLFRGISFLDENRIMFRTWLQGLEPSWQPYQEFPHRRIRYTNLPSGEYRFHIQARNSVGEESLRITSEFFRVGEHFTQIWWFILLEVFAGLLLVMGVFFLFMGRRFQEQLKIEVRQRTQELRQTEKAVRSESRRLNSILTSISDGVLALDNNLKIVLSNPKVLSILGVGLGEVVGRDLGEILTVEPPLIIGAGAGPVGCPSYRFTDQEGQHRFLEISVAPMAFGGESPSGWVLAFRDVTDRQNREKELIRTQQLESLGVLAGGIAHDFNNLLTIMLGNLSLVESVEVFGEEERIRLERMKVATYRARGLAEQLLTFAKGGDPQIQAVDIGALVQQCTAFALSGSKVSSRIRIPSGLWPVSGDPGQLGQVVNNLVINAKQAMPNGGVMDLELHNLLHMPGHLEEGRCVCMEISDKGEGIEPENLDHIFNPYFTTKGTGSGLGLTIAHSIITHHGGLIQAESEPGLGTVLRIYLPAADSDPEKVETRAILTFPVGLQVLVLDDEKEVLLLAEQMLRLLGIKCVGVLDGEAAVQAFALAMGQNKPFSVFIADLTIPGGVGGVEAFKKIRAMDKTVGGIVISGYSNDAVMANYKQYGFDSAIRKPFEQAQLAESLDLALRGIKKS